jgi:hypothetical protein
MRKISGWFRGVSVCPLVELLLTLLCCIHRCGRLLYRDHDHGIHVLNHETLLNVWISAAIAEHPEPESNILFIEEVFFIWEGIIYEIIYIYGVMEIHMKQD